MILKQTRFTNKYNLTDFTIRVRVDLGVMTIKGYSTLPKSPELEPNYQMQFSVILGALSFEWWVLTLYWRIQSVYSEPHQQGGRY